jgi:hypothetical protein
LGTSSFGTAAVLLLLPALLSAQIRIKPRLYIGFGLGRTLNAERPAFSADSLADQDYADINLSSLQRHFLRGQIRINLVDAGDFSLGYLFWSHSIQYPNDLIEYWQRDGKLYPYSSHAALHAVTLQWNMKFLSGRRIVPFLLGGAGRYYGNTDVASYWSLDSYRLQFAGTVEQERTDEGRAFLVGAGATFFRYTFAYVGFIQLSGYSLPSRRFLDAVIGLTI